MEIEILVITKKNKNKNKNTINIYKNQQIILKHTPKLIEK
jgi:hypothetical protein